MITYAVIAVIAASEHYNQRGFWLLPAIANFSRGQRSRCDVVKWSLRIPIALLQALIRFGDVPDTGYNEDCHDRQTTLLTKILKTSKPTNQPTFGPRAVRR